MAVAKAPVEAILKGGQKLTEQYLRDAKLFQISYVVTSEWPQSNSVSHCAGAYLIPMQKLREMTDMYGEDDAKSIVLYALSNMTGWKGEVAKMVKAELNRRVKETK